MLNGAPISREFSGESGWNTPPENYFSGDQKFESPDLWRNRSRFLGKKLNDFFEKTQRFLQNNERILLGKFYDFCRTIWRFCTKNLPIFTGKLIERFSQEILTIFVEKSHSFHRNIWRFLKLSNVSEKRY